MPLPQFQLEFEPIADLAAIVELPQVRFTLLSERLVRMEYSSTSEFEDHPSLAFWRRRQPVPNFQVRRSKERLEIETPFLNLVYQASRRGFIPANLSIQVKATGQTWQYGDPYWRGGNLMGTARTLDGAIGEVNLEPGLVGRAGWAVVDDSDSLVFNELGWLETRQHPQNIDLYFFGYGHDYPAALHDFCQVTGRPPLVPRWILGNWWSRYWAYTQDELLGLMQDFKDHEVPLSVCIVDMDWHITQTGNRSSGWTGYTWNRELFPDPPGFIQQLHDMGLHTALNLHPADGVYPHEEQYRQFAEAMDIDPAKGDPIPFDSTDPQFVRAYFDLLHHPLEEQGVDFWWIDWQQGARSRLAGLDPLWWLNHLHFYDLGRDGYRRPFIFSRWGGLGNHRYPIGFSGDTVVGWEALANLPGFTATAANVCYGWWSHDIGGHMGGIEDDELYARWVQYGVFSPIFRLHSTNNPFHERRPWGRSSPQAALVASEAMRLRHALIPYLYSMAWRGHTTSLPLITPMYYSHPENDEAYLVPQQYWFGSELLAAPFTSPALGETGLARQTLWLPAGDWFDFFTGECIRGGDWRTIYGEIEDIPVFARAGAIIPLGPGVGWGGVENPTELRLLVFPGADNRFELVEDDGRALTDADGAYAVTVFTQTWNNQEAIIRVSPARGDLNVLPQSRLLRLMLRGFTSQVRVQAYLNDADITLDTSYDLPTETLSFAALPLQPGDEFKLSVQAVDGSLISARDRSIAKLNKYLKVFRLDSWVKQEIVRRWPDVAAGNVSLRSGAAITDAQLAVLESLL